MRGKKVKEGLGLRIGRWIIRILLFTWTVTIVFPVIWVLYTSFKTNKEFFADMWALPTKFMFENYEFAWNTAQFSKYFANSFYVVAISVLLTLLVSSTTAYVIAKYRWRWIKGLERFYLLVMTIPGVLVLVPQYFMLLNMGMNDKLWVVAALHSLGSVPINIMMQIGFMRSVDDALFEAADIDGATEFQKYFYVMIPSVKSVLFLTTLTGILGSWNEFILTLTYINDETKYTVSVGLSHLQNASTYGVQYGGLFAGLVLAMVPILVVYAIFQKPLQEGIRMDGGVKG